MTDIDIQHKHCLSLEDAQNTADELAAELAESFAIDYGWDGDHVVFERPGVHGSIEVSEQVIHIQAKLNFLLSALKPKIEKEIKYYFTHHFGDEAE